MSALLIMGRMNLMTIAVAIVCVMTIFGIPKIASIVSYFKYLDSSMIVFQAVEDNKYKNNNVVGSRGIAKLTAAIMTTSTNFTNLTQIPIDIVEPYQLTELNISFAKISYEYGFWQMADPIPLPRWKAISNTTCIHHDDADDDDTNNKHNKDDTPQYDNRFHHRVPYVMILGVQKGGTSALANYLKGHDNIQKIGKKEFHYFSETLDKNKDIIRQDSGIRSQTILQYLQNVVIGNHVPLDKLRLSSHLHIMDATPNYLFFSDRVPQRILCTTPWVKLLVLLRNPVDRAFSHYYMMVNRLKRATKLIRSSYVPTFEEFVDMDIQVLKEIGVLRQFTSIDEFDAYSGSEEEWEAWSTYTKLGLNSPIGRGLYAIQLRHWINHMDNVGKDPKTDLLVLQSERMRNNTETVYHDVLTFLQFPQSSLQKYKTIHKTNYQSQEMNVTTRERLEALFRPYNRQLENILGNEWQGVWE